MNLFIEEQEGEVTRVPKECGIENPIGEQEIGDAPALCNKVQTFHQGKLTVKLAFVAKSGQNLFTAENLKSICRLEHKVVRKYYNFDDHCHKANGTQHCCPSWSVGHFIALLNGKDSCLSINENEVKKTGSLLKMCSRYYYNNKLKPDCWDFRKNAKGLGKCTEVPDNCTTFNAVYNILHYLTNTNFVPNDSNSSPSLRYSLVLVPIKENAHFQVDIYKSRLKSGDLSDGDVELSAYEFSKLKFEIFNERMLADLYLVAIAMFLIIIILWLYTRSFLITVLVGLIVVSSLVIAYFIYTIVLGMKFFPFLNILTSVFLVGIAADDAFVYIDIWNQSTRERREKRGGTPSNKDERDQEMIHVTVETMKHASMSMFVTSFTTSSAFFASLTSEIASIRLFGLYSGLSILCMFFLMVTWLPAAVIIEQTVFSEFRCCSKFFGKIRETVFKGTCGFRAVVNTLKAWHNTFFTDFLPRVVIKLRFFWLLFLFLLAVGGVVVSTVKPGLQLPSSQDFQMFHESHELEKYPLNLKKNFYFETTKRSSFPINFIWGIHAADTGDQFDPYDMGDLKWDSDFDIASKEGQQWIVDFLRRLKKQPFFAKEQKTAKKCFVEEFFDYMKTNCTSDNTVCCNDSKFPYNSSVFSTCMRQLQCERIKKNQFSSQSIKDSAPLYNAKGQLKAISLKFDSNVPFTWSYDPADKFWQHAEGWAGKEFSNAPSSMNNGWFVSELEFYDLQKSLSKGTYTSMSISIAIAFAIMLLTTGNFYISVFAIVTIICALGVTVGSLVLMGWKLNILESITLSVSVGLSVDFALHYGVAYVLAADKTHRKSRVWFSLTGMSSAITMAAFTTFITGTFEF